MIYPNHVESVKPAVPDQEWSLLPPENTAAEWTPVPLENLSPEAWSAALETGAYAPDAVRAVGNKAIELVVRGGVPLPIKKEADGSFSLPIRRAGSLFSFVDKHDLKKQGLQRLRINPDGKEVSMIGASDKEEAAAVYPQLRRKIPMGNAAMVPDFAYKPASPRIKSFLNGKLNFVIFH